RAFWIFGRDAPAWISGLARPPGPGDLPGGLGLLPLAGLAARRGLTLLAGGALLAGVALRAGVGGWRRGGRAGGARGGRAAPGRGGAGAGRGGSRRCWPAPMRSRFAAARLGVRGASSVRRPPRGAAGAWTRRERASRR